MTTHKPLIINDSGTPTVQEMPSGDSVDISTMPQGSTQAVLTGQGAGTAPVYAYVVKACDFAILGGGL